VLNISSQLTINEFIIIDLTINEFIINDLTIGEFSKII
jgi:hypothetical protein